MNTGQEKKFYGWKLVGVLFIVYLFNTGFPTYGGTVLNQIMSTDPNMHITRTVLGIGASIYMLMQGLPGPFIGELIHRKGARFTLTVGSVLIIFAGIFIALFVQNGWTYILGYGFLMSLGSNMGTQLGIQQTINYWFSKRRALAMGIVMTAAGIGGFVAPKIINYLLNGPLNGNWHIAWYIISGFAVLTTLLIVLLVKNKPADIGQIMDGVIYDEENESDKHKSTVFRNKESVPYKEVLRTKSFWLIILGSTSFLVCHNLSFAHGVLHFIGLGYDRSVAVSAFSGILLISICGRLLPGLIGHRIEPKYIVGCSVFSMGIASVCAIFAAKSIILVYIFSLLMGMGLGSSMVCIPTILANFYGPEYYAKIMGVKQMVAGCIGALTPVMGGKIFDMVGSYTIAYIIVGIIACMGGICFCMAKPPQKTT